MWIPPAATNIKEKSMLHVVILFESFSKQAEIWDTQLAGHGDQQAWKHRLGELSINAQSSTVLPGPGISGSLACDSLSGCTRLSTCTEKEDGL
jgi:hypothetical protein